MSTSISVVIIIGLIYGLAHEFHCPDTTVASIPIVDIDDDDAFDPNQKKKKRSKIVSKDIAEPEAVRKETHTLEEHHEHLLSASYDLSFNGSAHDAGQDPSSSQIAGAGFDNFFSDILEDGGAYGLDLGEDLARELGWGISPIKSVRERSGFIFPSETRVFFVY
jgi:hypothetical protein